jgi:hypothetical protein
VKRFGQLELSLDNYSTLPLELALVDCTINEPEDKKEPVRQTEPDPPNRQATFKATPPPPRPKTTVPHVENRQEQVEKPAASEKPAPSPTAKVEASPAAVVSTIGQLQQQWSKMINDAPDGMSKTPAAALLRSSRPKEIVDDILIVSFKYPILKDNMEKLENQKMAEKIVSKFMGRSCKVRCVYEHENNHLVKAALEMGAQVINNTEET